MTKKTNAITLLLFKFDSEIEFLQRNELFDAAWSKAAEQPAGRTQQAEILGYYYFFFFTKHFTR